MIGHSLGEWVAATLAGVFSLEDALRLVARRAELMHQAPSGAMLMVALPEAQIRALITARWRLPLLTPLTIRLSPGLRRRSSPSASV